MQPRVVFRTHYQIDEPAYLGLLITACSSPTRGDYAERIAERLVKAVGRTDRRINLPAAAYAVDLARGLGLLTSQAVWTDLGMLVHLFVRDPDSQAPLGFELNPAERLLYARIFLEGDGAALWYLARHLQEHESVPDANGDWNSLARQMFLTIYGEYLKITSTTADRVALRGELDRIRRKGYTGKSGSHKCFVHLQAMARIGIIDRKDGASSRHYVARQETAAVASAINNIVHLEQVVQEQRWIEVILHLAGITTPFSTPDTSTIHALLSHYYRRVTRTGIPLCSLKVLTDAVQIHGLLRGSRCDGAVIIAAIRAAQQESPRSVRLHVDRSGQPAFLRLSEDLLTTWAGGASVTGV